MLALCAAALLLSHLLCQAGAPRPRTVAVPEATGTATTWRTILAEREAYPSWRSLVSDTPGKQQPEETAATAAAAAAAPSATHEAWRQQTEQNSPSLGLVRPLGAAQYVLPHECERLSRRWLPVKSRWVMHAFIHQLFYGVSTANAAPTHLTMMAGVSVLPSCVAGDGRQGAHPGARCCRRKMMMMTMVRSCASKPSGRRATGSRPPTPGAC
jgi:hypothetical protein